MFHGFFQNVPKDWHLEIYLQLGNKTAIRSFVMPDLSAIIPGGRLTLSPITPSLAGHSTFSAFSDVRGLNSTAAAEPSTTSALPSHFEDRPIEDVLALCRLAHLYCTFETPDAHLQFNPASFIVHKCDSCEG